MIFAIGKVNVAAAGTPVQVYAGSPIERGKWMTVSVNPGNTGTVYLGTKGMNKSTLAGVFAILPKTSNPFQIFVESCGINPEEIYVDADNTNDYIVAGLAD